MIVTTLRYRMRVNHLLFALKQLAGDPQMPAHLAPPYYDFIAALERHVATLYPPDQEPIE